MVSNNNTEALDEEDVFGEGAIKPMKHSTIQKLKRLGKITDKDMLGGMLKSEAAKEFITISSRNTT